MGFRYQLPTSSAAKFLAQELVENGFAESAGDGVLLIEWDDFERLEEEEVRLLGLPCEVPCVLVVDIQGVMNRRGAKFQWEVEVEEGRFNRERVELPLLHFGDASARLPIAVCRGIEAIEWFGALENPGVENQYRLVQMLQGLPHVELPPELRDRRFVFADELQLHPVVVGDVVTLNVGGGELGAEDTASLTEVLDRKSNLIRLPAQLPSSFRAQGEDGEEVFVAFPERVKADLVRVSEIRKRRMSKRAFLEELRDNPTLGFDELNIDLAAFSERVMRIGLFIPQAEMVLTRSENEWIPSIETRDESGEIKRLLIRTWSELERLLEAIEEAETEGNALLEFKAVWMTVVTAKELAIKCEEALKANEFQEPTGRLMPIVDEDAEEDQRALALSKLTCEVPSELAPHITLFPHQLTGVAWLQALHRDEHTRGGLLADDMGLGKTIQLLTFLHWHRQQQVAEGTNRPYLLVAPVALLQNWEQEAQRFFPTGMEVLVAHRATAAALQPAELGRDFIIVTNYETLTRQILRWATVDWAVVALDEAQQIKNANTLKSQAARALKSTFNVALTGTPVENRLMEFWAIMDFVEPGFLGSAQDFREQYERSEQGASEEAAAALRKVVGLRMLRRVKEEVLEDLPPKVIQPAAWDGTSFHELSAPLTAAQVRGIHEFKRQYELDCLNPAIGPAAMLKAIQGFRAIADHPLVADGLLSPILESNVDQLLAGSAKLQVTLSLLDQIHASDEKVIVFSALRLSQQLLKRVIQERFGIEVPLINGETPVSESRTRTSRQGIIEAFKERAGFGVLVLSPLAAGVGLNITSANHVIHFTRHWNPAKEAQATDRAHRIGQQKQVNVYYPMGLSDEFMSFDAVLHKLLMKKAHLAEQSLTPTTDLKEADFIEMMA